MSKLLIKDRKLAIQSRRVVYPGTGACGCCDGGGGGTSDPRCCALPGQLASRSVGTQPNSFAAAPVSVSINMTLTITAFSETGANPWTSQVTTRTYTASRVEPNPEYVENSPNRFACSTLPFTTTTFNVQQSVVQNLVGGGTNTSNGNRQHRYGASVVYGYQQSNGWTGTVGFSLVDVGAGVSWNISAPIGPVVVQGSTRPNSVPIGLFLNQFPSPTVPISYSDSPASVGFTVSGSGSRTYFPQGVGLTQVTEDWTVNISVSGGPFSPCSGQLTNSTGCTNCGQDTATGGLIV